MKGPLLTDQDGMLDEPILICSFRGYRCSHFAIHDRHYYYCSAQESENQHSEGFAYPWRGAGVELATNEPNEGCPYIKESE